MIQPVLLTERLSLRPFVLSDSPEVQRLAGDKRIADVTAHIPHPYPDGAAEDWINTHQSKWQSGEGVTYAITRQSDGQLLGTISLMKLQQKKNELGYWIGADYWGQGYATEACIELVRFAREQFAIKRVYACHLVRNAASGRVLLKSGLKYTGRDERSCGYRKEVEAVDEYEQVFEEPLPT